MARQCDMLPCPYCRNEYTVLPNEGIKDRGQYVCCAKHPAEDSAPSCGACGPQMETVEEAIWMWNSGPVSRLEGTGLLTGIHQITAIPGALFALCQDGSVWVKSFMEGGIDSLWRRENMMTQEGRDARNKQRRTESSD